MLRRRVRLMLYAVLFRFAGMLRFISVIFFSLMMLASPVLADCTSPAEPAGKFIYNRLHKLYQYCNGSSWVAVAMPQRTCWSAFSAIALNSWYAVAYGNGTFVAVSLNGTNRVMTSPDGIAWTPRTAAIAVQWISVNFENNLFIAFSTTGEVMTSPDGITWTSRAASELNQWRDVAYGNGLFVAVSINGTNRVMTSPDGFTWTARAAADASSWTNIEFANGIFVATAFSGTTAVMTSTDGITWTSRTVPELNTWQALKFANGLFVALAASGTNRAMTSPDGINWTARYAPPYDWRGLDYGNGMFAAISATGAYRGMTSVDGITWTSEWLTPANSWHKLAFGNGRFVGVSSDGTSQVIIRQPCTCSTPTGTQGQIIYNSSQDVMQYCKQGSWAAMGKSPGWAMQASTFDNTPDYLSGNITDSGSTGFAFSFWIKPLSRASDVDQTIFTNNNSRFTVRLLGRSDTDNRYDIEVRLLTNAGANYSTYQSLSEPITAGVWSHVALSGTSAAQAKAYVNDAVPASGSGTSGAGTADYYVQPFYVGVAAGGGSQQFNGDIAEFWMNDAEFDMAVLANRRKFITAGLQAEYLGKDGSLPTGSIPTIYLNAPAATFGNNRGTGGSFTVNGLFASATPPSHIGPGSCVNPPRAEGSLIFNSTSCVLQYCNSVDWVSLGKDYSELAGTTWTPRDSARDWWAVASSADGTNLAAVVSAGQIYTSTDSGANWTARESVRNWRGIASSSDGTRLAAVELNGEIYTSTDSGVNWTPRAFTGSWTAIASSADGTRLAATYANAQIYTSTDSGLNWTARESNRDWTSITSSSDGMKLAATAFGGQIYTSSDGGVNWTARESNRNWYNITSSADGVKLAAVDNLSQIYTSTDSGVNWTARETNRDWFNITSSSDGTILVATVLGGQIYISRDSGVTWTANESNRGWVAAASSADGTKLVALDNGGQIYTSSRSSPCSP